MWILISYVFLRDFPIPFIFHKNQKTSKMAALDDAHLPSSDDSDEDFVPSGKYLFINQWYFTGVQILHEIWLKYNFKVHKGVPTL